MAPPAKQRRQTGNLPADLTTFVGRNAERTSVRRLMASSRLVTLTGFGGVGKTRLALRVAADTQRVVRGGVWLVELAALDNPELLPDTVAKAVGLHAQRSGGVLGALVEFFGPRGALLLFDNCEHLIDDCSRLLGELLRRCPDLHVLATSRQALGILGEVTFPLAPLPVPPEDEPTGAGSADFDAVALFLDRAAAAAPGFQLTEDNRDAVFGICRRLEGIPLALELAAVRLRGLSPQLLLDRLSDHLNLLTSGNRTAAGRQQTLRACIEWSYHLCTETERDLWAMISVFSGGFDLDAAEAVCADESRGLDPTGMVNTLLSLVDQSVLSRETRGGTTRYWTLGSLKRYGLEKLEEAGLSDVTQRRHRDFYAQLAAVSETEYASGRQRLWMDRLHRDHTNLQAALEYCLEEPDGADRGLDMAAAIREHWIAIGALREGRHWLERLLDAGPGEPATRARALRTAAWLASLQGDLDAAHSFLRELRGVVAGLDDGAHALAHEVAAVYALFTNAPQMSVQESRRALSSFRARGELAREIGVLIVLQMAHSRAGDFEQAQRWHDVCMETTGQAGDRWFRSYSLWQAGLTHLRQGDGPRAIGALRESLRLKIELTDALGIALVLEGLAWATRLTDQHRAAVLLGAAAARWEAIGLRPSDMPQTSEAHVACEAALRQEITRDEFALAVDRGMGLSYGEALDFAAGSGNATPAEEEPSEEPDSTDMTPLTGREQEVALLVARGLSNKAIAAALVISPRTAEAHVDHILVKLGFNTRAQIAAWVGERQPIDYATRPGQR